MSVPEENKYLVDYLVESHACIPEGRDGFVFRHPGEDLEIHVGNHNVSRPIDVPTLSVQVILYADSLEDAETTSREKLRQFLDLASFAIQAKFVIHSVRRVVEWGAGLEERKCIQVFEHPDPDIPYEIFDGDVLASLHTLASLAIDPELRRAFGWFRHGASAVYAEDRFQYFWFALEVAAKLKRAPDLVPDLCPRCRQPLHCSNCGEEPTHRPYPIQAIEQLIKRHLDWSEAQYIIDESKKARNALLHGDDPDVALEGSRFTLGELANFVGQVAWTALADSVLKQIQAKGDAGRLVLRQINAFQQIRQQFRAHLTVRTRDPDKPTLEELPSLDISLEVHRRQVDEQEVNGNDNNGGQ